MQRAKKSRVQSPSKKIGIVVKQAEAVVVAERYRDRLLLIYQILTILPAIGWGLHYLQVGTHQLVAWVDVLIVVLLSANIVGYRRHRNYEFSELLYRFAALFLLMTFVATGAEDGTGIYWAIAYPPMTFAINGRRRGLQSMTMFSLALIAVMVMGSYGVLPSFYDHTAFIAAWSVMILLASVAYAKEKEREAAFGEIVANRERLRVLLESLPAGVIMFDKAGVPVAANPAAEALLGRTIDPRITLDKFIERYALVKEGDGAYPQKEFPVTLALNNDAITVKDDVFVNRPDGSKVVLRFSAAPVHGTKGGVVSAVAVFEDATKEHEIDQMKSEFVSLASHQLKSPLAGIRWSVETLLDGDSGTLNKEQRTAVEQIDGVVARLTALVGDLLNVSRIETGRKFNVVPVPTDMAALVRTVIKDGEAVAAKRGIVVTSSLPDPLMLAIDPRKMQEAIANLVGNAIKYSKDGGKVEVGLHAKNKDGVTVFVKDGGWGIPKAQQKKVFEKFFRAENVAELVEGTGLGLYIVKALIEKHGGKIWFESEEGKGTTFFLTLPAA